jgi:hypothetical protein
MADALCSTGAKSEIRAKRRIPFQPFPVIGAVVEMGYDVIDAKISEIPKCVTGRKI